MAITSVSGTWLDPTMFLDARVESLLVDLSRDEKIAMALSDWSPLQRRGLPWPHYVDAGTGLRGIEGATAFPAGIALAASFDEDLAERYGAAVGAEVRTAGYSVLLGPTLDLARDPRGGRIPEAFGEDPFLSGLLGAAHVRGVRRNNVIAQLKHFVAYNSEERRTGHGPPWARGEAIDARVSRATLQHVYLRPFRMAVEAGAWSMMGSYNRLNGEYVCESRDVLDIPRGEWGWRGFYCPDFIFAVRDDAKALAAGLDLGALVGPGNRTAEMLTSPDLPPDTLDTIVGNVVRALIGSGLADHPLPEPGMPSTPEHRELARGAAVASTVLLVNRDDTLPLGTDVRSITLIGPSGADAIYAVGGSASVTINPERAVSPLDGLCARAGSAVEVLPAQGSLGDVPLPIIPAAAFALPDGSGPGVLVECIGVDGSTTTRVLLSIDHSVGPDEMEKAWPHRWSTVLTSAVSGRHRLSLSLGGRATVRVDGRVVMQGSRELERFFAGPAYPLQQLNSFDAYTDCPTREQRAWVGDGVVHQLVDLTTNNDWGLARNYVELGNSPRSDGILPMSVVGDIEAGGGLTIPDWSLSWLHGSTTCTCTRATCRGYAGTCRRRNASWGGTPATSTLTARSATSRSGTSSIGRASSCPGAVRS